MSGREKILLAVTGVVAVIGLWVGLNRQAPVPSAPKAQGNETAQAAAMLQSIKDTALSQSDIKLLSAIDGKWPVAAFYDKPLSGHEAVKPSALPHYSGYVELGSGKLAVVDGMEYQVGDALEGGGYKVTSITPDQVGLESLANGQQVTIPYEGQDAPKQ